MMHKVLVNIFVPVLNQSYDIFIPIQLRIFEVTELIKKAIFDLSEGRFIPMRDTVIAFRASGKILDVNHTVFELGIGNAAKLMLI